MTLILTELVFVVAPFDTTRSKKRLSTSYLILVGNPGIIEVPPDIRILLYNYLRVFI
jgi:hypothetical protein